MVEPAREGGISCRAVGVAGGAIGENVARRGMDDALCGGYARMRAERAVVRGARGCTLRLR